VDSRTAQVRQRVAGCFVAALVAAGSLAAAEASADALTPGAFGAFADSIMTAHLAAHHIPGAVLVAVKDGAVFFARGYGVANLDRNVPVDPDRTMFRVASVSKLVTATAAMQLVEQGSLALDRDVNAYLTDFQIPATYPEPVTLFHLLTHTAGFDERGIDRKSLSAPTGSLGDYLARRMPPRIMPPGQFICYSNHGMALAGHLVERAAGEPFERYVATHVFQPLGMERSSFAFLPEPVSDLATGYSYGASGYRPVPAEYIRTVPASMLSMTGADAARFMLAHLQDGRLGESRILADSTARRMHARQFAQDPSLSGIAFGFWERFERGERALWHDGDRAGFGSLLYLLPDRGFGMFVAYNSRGGGEARGDLVRVFHQRFGAAATDSGATALAGAAAPPFHGDGPPLQRFAGTYLFNRYSHRSLEKLVTLGRGTKVTIGHGDTLEVNGETFARVGPLRFRSARGGGLVFRVDRSGAVTHLFAGRTIARVYERLPWYATDRAQLAAVVMIVLGFLIAIVVWPLFALMRRRARRPSSAGVSRGAKALAMTVALLDVGFIACVATVLASGGGGIEYGMPLTLTIALLVPMVTTVLVIAVAWRCIAAWRRSEGSIAERIQMTWVTLAELAFVPLLLRLNLLGIHT